MKKKIGDLTLRVLLEMCYKCEECYGCPLLDIFSECPMRSVSKDELNEEIEVEEDE